MGEVTWKDSNPFLNEDITNLETAKLSGCSVHTGQGGSAPILSLKGAGQQSCSRDGAGIPDSPAGSGTDNFSLQQLG